MSIWRVVYQDEYMEGGISRLVYQGGHIGEGICGWVYQGDYTGVTTRGWVCVGCHSPSPLAVLPGVARLAGGAAVPAASQTLTGPGEPAGDTGRGGGVSPPQHPPPQHWHSLVFRVREGTGAGLAVLGGPGGGIPVETGGTLVTEIPCCVVQASLGGHTNIWGCTRVIDTQPPQLMRMEGLTEQAPLSGWQLSEWPLHSQSSQCPRYSPPPVRV